MTYKLVIAYSISKPNDIDIIDEGIADSIASEDLDVLKEILAGFIAEHGDRQHWDDLDGYVGSCWLPLRDFVNADQDNPNEIEFQASISHQSHELVAIALDGLPA